jgi:hypothetical protein
VKAMREQAVVRDSRKYATLAIRTPAEILSLISQIFR